MDKKKVILSGIQPTGVFTLGNYLGAVKNWAELQDEYSCAYMVADLHALTVREKPAELRKRSLDSFALLLACGIDPDKSLVFMQSHVPNHTKLSWVLSCYTQFGELSRMTQFKEKSAKNTDNINAGLFTYPSLMAADILLYGTNLVPVGDDQKQHLELTRDVATRFNSIYGDVFTVPEPYIPKQGARIMSLSDPTKKMSKSDDNQNSFISILDSKDRIISKFKKAVTDSDQEIRFGEGKDGINNLISIYSSVTKKTMDETVNEFKNSGYGDFKLAVAEVVADELKPIRDEFSRIREDKALLESLYKKGAENATYATNKMINKVYRKVGLVDFK